MTQRLKAFEEEPYTPSAREKTEGTELLAIIGLLREHVDREEDRIRLEQQESYKRWREED